MTSTDPKPDWDRLRERARSMTDLAYAPYSKVRVGAAALAVHRNEAEGKLGVLCLAPQAGQGITDVAKREAVGEDRITLFQRMAGTKA